MAFNFRKFFEGLKVVPKTTTSSDSSGDLEVLSSDNKLRYHNGTSNSPVVTESHSATLTNKTIDADSNTISNIDNNEIKALAGIDATKIADGSVDNAEYQYINSLTSNAQTQLNNKQPLDSTLTALAGFNTNGFIAQTATDVFSGRTIVGTTNQVNVLNGDGSGNPTLSTPQDIHSGATPSFAQVAVSADPSSALQVATKQYVDNLLAGIKWKHSVLVATTANITLSGEQTIDGVLTSSSYVLVKDQTDQKENGIYISSSGPWSRSPDTDTGAELVSATTLVERGTLNAEKIYTQSADSVTIGVTNIVWVQAFSSGSLPTTDGQGIEISGTVLSLELDGTSLVKSASGLKVNPTGAGANVTLSNLTSPTAINQNLLPDITGTRDIGQASSPLYWNKIYVDAIQGSADLGISASGSLNLNPSLTKVNNLRPTVDLTKDLGDASFRWNNIWGKRLDAGASQLVLSGSSINMGAVQVKNAADGTDPQDLVTKAQLDAAAGSTKYIWQGNHTQSVPWENIGSGFAEAFDETGTFVETLNINFGSVDSLRANPTQIRPGISFTTPSIGYYQITATMYAIADTTNTDAAIQLVDLAGTVIGEARNYITTSSTYPIIVTGVVYMSSLAANNIRLKLKSDSFTVRFGGGDYGLKGLYWSIHKI